MSRTTIFTVLAILGAVLAVFAKALGLAIDPAGVVAGLTGILVYVFGALKTDLAGLNQPGIWKDPKVWIAAVTALLTGLAEAGITLPISPEIIITVLTVILGLLFKPVTVVQALRERAARVRFQNS